MTFNWKKPPTGIAIASALALATAVPAAHAAPAKSVAAKSAPARSTPARSMPAKPVAAKPATATAQPIELVGDVKLEKTVTENGVTRQVLSEPSVVVPGDRLIFSTTYRNTGATAVRNFVVTNPLPTGVALSDLGTAPAQVSTDGGKTWGALAALIVADGKGGQRAAVPGDVTHVRWTLPLVAPRATGALSFHAVVR